ncbi:winged helix-turn-helix domain-containing protein [Poriferisphaera sp. WC338]|uniref:winged helix-turn-helix domain-containing protein n=1 Tax=Poriferisphaera sp. WC338 TaxID=3425129 RepID=UPI003D81AB19
MAVQKNILGGAALQQESLSPTDSYDKKQDHVRTHAVTGQIVDHADVELLRAMLVGEGNLCHQLHDRMMNQKMSLQTCGWDSVLSEVKHQDVGLIVLVAEENHEQKLLIAQQVRSMLRMKGKNCSVIAVSREIDAEDIVSWLGLVDDLLAGENIRNERLFFARLKARLRPAGYRIDWNVKRYASQSGIKSMASGEDVDQHIVGPIVVWPAKFEVRVSGARVMLTLTQFRLLELLMRRPGWILTPDTIRETLGLESGESGDAVVKNHIYMLRRRLGREAASLVETVRGVGYRIRAEEPTVLDQG